MQDLNNLALLKSAELIGNGTAFVVATVVGSKSPTSAVLGAKAILTEKGVLEGFIGGGCVEALVIKEAKKAILAGTPTLVRVLNKKLPKEPEFDKSSNSYVKNFTMTCHSGGEVEVFLDPVIPAKQLLVIGSSPVAKTLLKLAYELGFGLISMSGDFNLADVPSGCTVVDKFELNQVANFSPIAVIVATQGKRDETALKVALGCSTSYVALVASKRKADKLCDYLLESGYSKKDLKVLHSPAGVEIDAKTPSEIALSILAEVVKKINFGDLKQKRNQKAGSAAQKVVDVDKNEAIDLVCEMSVDKETTQYKKVHNFETYYFCNEHCMDTFTKNPKDYLQTV